MRSPRVACALTTRRCAGDPDLDRSPGLGVSSVVSDPTRRRILRELLDGERSVGELVGSLGLPQPTVSKHLKVLRDRGVRLERHLDKQEQP